MSIIEVTGPATIMAMHDGTLHSPIGGDGGAAANLALLFIIEMRLVAVPVVDRTSKRKIVPEPFPNTFTINTDSAITQFWIMIAVHLRPLLTYRSFLGSSRLELISEPENQ
jgi:hypothetical protein